MSVGGGCRRADQSENCHGQQDQPGPEEVVLHRDTGVRLCGPGMIRRIVMRVSHHVSLRRRMRNNPTHSANLAKCITFDADQRLNRRWKLFAALQQRRWCGHRHHYWYWRPEPELAQEDTDVDGAYTSSNTRRVGSDARSLEKVARGAPEAVAEFARCREYTAVTCVRLDLVRSSRRRRGRTVRAVKLPRP